MKKALTTIAVLAALQAQADTEHLGAHVHGEATMDIVLEGDELKIALVSPAMNFIGFEHEATTDEQKAHSAKVLGQLKAAEGWLTINGGGCELHESDVDWGEGEHKHDEKHDHDHKHDEKHDHDHKHDEKHDHDHKHDEKHDHEHKHDHNHSDIKANFDFDCKKPGAVKGLAVKLFEQFPGLEKLKIQWIVGEKQSAEILTKEAKTLKFK